MNITLQKTDRAEKKWIMVDGVRWGDVWRTSHGMYAPTYTFHYPDNGELMEPTNNGKRERNIVVTAQNKHEKRWAKNPDEVDKRTTDERVTDKIKELIASGQLKSPEAKAAETAEELRAYRERQKAIEDRENAEFDQKAREALEEHRYDDTPISTDQIAAVVAAMRWAQTK